MSMPAGKARVTGSGYSTFVYAGKPIAYLISVEDAGQRAWSDKGQAYSFIHPMGSRTPTEIATSRVLSGGTLQLTIQELWDQAHWEHMAGMAGTNNVVEIFERLSRTANYVTAQTIIKPPGTESNPSKWRGKIYHNVTIVDIMDGDTLTVGGLDVAKPVVCAFTHTSRLR
ncbi:hypothetical protein QFZ75_007902 [Streptomyces sp. V3I8]|uniref:hypothetical protein n=1 Tax=Streptomyces sp. V3I8 TaxID=3042279 RepID=UPI0027812A0B|nr:hypothetical protein [Streptomyces sp. V3I8]MDQ1041400.1 hypothetical protein [Streptomyces sp. V3I8]